MLEYQKKDKRESVLYANLVDYENTPKPSYRELSWSSTKSYDNGFSNGYYKARRAFIKDFLKNYDSIQKDLKAIDEDKGDKK